jgi:hypothetical protein
MKCSVRGPYLSIPLLELEGYDIVAEFLSHPFSVGHIENTVQTLLEFFETRLVNYVTVKIKNHI